MSSLTSLRPDSRAVVIGAAGGIGAAFSTALEDDPQVSVVHRFARSGADKTANESSIRYVDITDEASVRGAAQVATNDGPLDLVIVATGILHGANIRPEKSMRDIYGDAMAEVFRINTIGPALVAKHFLPAMRSGAKTVFAVLTARVGSIGDNRLGGWVSYRASKAAANMLVKTLSIEQARRRPESVVIALHPGTVDTGLSKPFQGNVPPERLFTPETSATRLLEVINSIGAKDTGGFFAWDGQLIPF